MFVDGSFAQHDLCLHVCDALEDRLHTHLVHERNLAVAAVRLLDGQPVVAAHVTRVEA